MIEKEFIMYNLRSSLCTTCGVHYVQLAEFIMYNLRSSLCTTCGVHYVQHVLH